MTEMLATIAIFVIIGLMTFSSGHKVLSLIPFYVAASLTWFSFREVRVVCRRVISFLDQTYNGPLLAQTISSLFLLACVVFGLRYMLVGSKRSGH